MPDLWFVAGLAIGIAVTGFCAVGSFDRGADSVRRADWALELAARKRAVIASRSRELALVTSHAKAQAAVARGNSRKAVTDEIDRLGRAITQRMPTREPDPGLALAQRAEVS